MFFYGENMIYVFFMLKMFSVWFFLWFCMCFSILMGFLRWFEYGFGMVLVGFSFPRIFFYHRTWIWIKIVKKIVNPTKVPRNSFLANNSRKFSIFFIDFGKISLSQKIFSITEIHFEANSYQNRKKIVNATKVPRNSFLAINSRNLRWFYDFGRNLHQNPFLW